MTQKKLAGNHFGPSIQSRYCGITPQKTTNNKQQTTNNKQKTTNNKQQTTNNKHLSRESGNKRINV